MKTPHREGGDQPAGDLHAFVYGEDGAMLPARSPNGVVARFDYAPLGLPAAVHLGREGEDAPIARVALGFDGRDALTEAADSALGRSRYAYDADGRLAEVSGAAPERFEHDESGNLVKHGRQEWEYDAANRLVSGTSEVGSADAHFRHDGDGNRVEDDGPEGRRFTFDALGLLARADLPGNIVAEYAHDPLGRRTVKRVTSGRGAVVETRWLWAGDALLSETVTDGDVLEARDFLFAPGSWAPLAQRLGGAVFCCHTDGRGAPTRLTDGRGRVAWAASYSAYGEARARTGTLRQPLRLPGQYHDEETGLHQNRWRMYDPSRGRYLSPDPLELLGGVNLYAYAQNDPVGNSDPLGLWPDLSLLTSHLPPQVMQRFQQARHAVSQTILSHLGPLRRLLPPAAPRPPDPAMSLAHPIRHLPPAPAPQPAAHGPAPRRAPAHKAPPPAKGAHVCPQALAAQQAARRAARHAPRHHHTPRPAPRPSDETPLLTWHELGAGLWTGLRRVYDFRRGTEQASQDMVNPVKIYQGAHALGDQLATLVPGADGQKTAPSTLARRLGHGFVEGINPFDKKSAFEAGEATANAASVLIPVGGEFGALNDLRVGLRAANLERAAAEAGLRAAEGTPEAAAAAARLRAAEAQVARARAAVRGAIPGVKAVRGVKRAAQKVKQGTGRARSAVAAARARRAAGGRDPNDPLAPHTHGSLKKGKDAAEARPGRWQARTRGQHSRPGQPALAGASDGGHAPPSNAIGKPEASMAEAKKGAAGGGPLKAEHLYDAKTRNLARQYGIAYDEASALKEVLESPSTKGIVERDGIPAVGEDNIAKIFRIDRNEHNLPEFVVQRKDGRFSAVEVKNQNRPDIASALSKFHEMSDLVGKNPTAIPGMGDYRMGQYVIYTREGNLGFNDALFSVGKDGNLLLEGSEYRVNGVPVQIKERPLIPQDKTGGR